VRLLLAVGGTGRRPATSCAVTHRLRESGDESPHSITGRHFAETKGGGAGGGVVGVGGHGGVVGGGEKGWSGVRASLFFKNISRSQKKAGELLPPGLGLTQL
jgi:hypothetical protein